MKPYTYYGLVMPYVVIDVGQCYAGYSLLPDDTKSLAEPMLTYYHLDL